MFTLWHAVLCNIFFDKCPMVLTDMLMFKWLGFTEQDSSIMGKPHSLNMAAKVKHIKNPGKKGWGPQKLWPQWWEPIPHHQPEKAFRFLGGLSLHLNHLIASRTANYDWPFGTLPFGLFGSNLDTRDLETYPRTYSGHFWNMSIFDDSRAVWVLFRKWVVSENQSFLNEGAIITPLSV